MESNTGDDSRNDCVSVCRSFCAETIFITPTPHIYPIPNGGQTLLFAIRHLLQMTSQCLNLLFVCIGLSLTFPLLTTSYNSSLFPLLNHLFHLSRCLTLLLCELLLQLLYRRALRLHLLLQRLLSTSPREPTRLRASLSVTCCVSCDCARCCLCEKKGVKNDSSSSLRR